MIDLKGKVCPFCKSELEFSRTSYYINRTCYCCSYQYQIKITSEDQGKISYCIKNIKFIYNFNDEYDENNMVYVKNYKDTAVINKHIIATPENYLQVIEKIKALQVFS